jgi:glycolate oxidase iron-sulfur subunit
MGWITPDAPTQAELDACVTCGLCLPHCPTYRATGDETASPRGRLTAMAAVADGIAEVDETFAEMMSFCLQCRACETACPSLVPFGRAMEGARAEIAAQLPDRRRSARRWVVGSAVANPTLVRAATFGAAVAQRIGLGRSGSGTIGKVRGLRPLPLRPPSTKGRSWPARGAPRGTVALLSGCVQDPWFAAVHDATIGVLRGAGFDVATPAGQACCGALAAHDGAVAQARALAAANVGAFAGYDFVVTDSAGCGAHMKEYGHWADEGTEFASRVVDITELVTMLLDEGVLAELPTNGQRVAVQDPCHLRHAQRITAAPRRVVRAAGFETVDLDPSGRCCGAAGMYTIAYPEMSESLGRAKAAEIEQTQASVVATANPGCEMQLRAYAAEEIRIVHPIELYAEAISRQ